MSEKKRIRDRDRARKRYRKPPAPIERAQWIDVVQREPEEDPDDAALAYSCLEAELGRWRGRIQRTGDEPYLAELWDKAGNRYFVQPFEDVGDAMKACEERAHLWSTCAGCGQPITAAEPLELVRGAAAHGGSHAVSLRQMLGERL